MRYRISEYARALSGALEGKNEVDRRAIARRFAEVLMRHRALGKAVVILAAYEKIALRAQGASKVRIESAMRVSAELRAKIRGILGAKIYFTEVENAGLLAGVKILIDDELLIDASGLRQIERMFGKK
ncbi:MAG: F0F1 ATP synthase subunit delta [Patescibacteria group bacterium]